MRIALCSKTMEFVDGNFNKSKYFMIYDITTAGAQFVEIREAKPIERILDEDEINERIDVIHDCKMVFCGHIPRTSKARLVNRGIFTVWMRHQKEVAVMLEELINHIRINPPPVIRKILTEEKLREV